MPIADASKFLFLCFALGRAHDSSNHIQDDRCCKDGLMERGDITSPSYPIDQTRYTVPGVALDKRKKIQECVNACGCAYGEKLFGALDNWPNLAACLAFGVNADLTDHLADVQDAKFASLKVDPTDASSQIPRKDALKNCAADPVKLACSTGCMCRDPTMTCSEYCEPASEQKMEWPSVVYNAPWSAVSFTVDGSEQKKSVLPTRTFPGLLFPFASQTAQAYNPPSSYFNTATSQHRWMSVFHLDLFIGPTSKHMSMRNTAGDKYYHRPTDFSANIATCLQSCNDMQICKESREESSNGSDPANKEESTENTGLIVGVIAGVFILGGVIGGTIYHRKSKKAKVAAGGGKGKSGYNSYRVEVKQKNTDNNGEEYFVPG